MRRVTQREAPGDPTGRGRDAAHGWVRQGRGPARRTRWDRPPAPHDWRFYVGWFGRALIIAGLAIFSFVAYQLWGTGIETARAQHRLEGEFAELVRDRVVAVTVPPTTEPPPTTDPSNVAVTTPATAPPTAPPTAPTTAPPPTTAVPPEQQGLPTPERGEPVARVVIPRIGVDDIVVSGVSRDELKLGPGHFRDTPLPGQLGNAAIAGHRTTSGAPFSDLDQLETGDEVDVTLANGVRYVFRVTGSEVVTPDQYEVITDADPMRATLTLVTCTPKWSSTHRLIVHAELDPARSGPVGQPTITGAAQQPEIDVPATTSPAPSTSPAPQPGDAVPETTPPATASPADQHDDTDAFSEGWFADSAAWPQLALWGLALAAVVTLGWWLARTWKREWVGVVAVSIPFVVVLYFFFQNANRLLPAGL